MEGLDVFFSNTWLVVIILIRRAGLDGSAHHSPQTPKLARLPRTALDAKGHLAPSCDANLQVLL